MSLDVTLTNEDGEDVFTCNITHNLNTMAEMAGMYEVLWRPEETGVTKAGHVAWTLREKIPYFVLHKAEFEAYNPSNGWGNYHNLLKFVVDYLSACEKHPSAVVSICR